MEDYELEAILRGLKKIENIAREAYYSTPTHIQSKALIERIIVISRNLYSYVYNKYILSRNNN
ncbi:MAG: hypothetical protein DRO40_06265 [Thermoprotei archaeon]|nr:MAG: hypothetical protein DRO40_06265 [Thermoprotei archaeon]